VIVFVPSPDDFTTFLDAASWTHHFVVEPSGRYDGDSGWVLLPYCLGYWDRSLFIQGADVVMITLDK